MLKEVKGDLLLTKSHAIAHGVAPNDDFKKGLAFALRSRWPTLYREFRHYSHNNHPKEGTVWTWSGPDDVLVYNLFTQEHAKDKKSHPGRATHAYVNSCLRHLKKELLKNKTESLALPKVATGVGGLKWSDVSELIHNNLSDLKIPIFIYSVYQKGLEAKEEI